MASNKSSNDKKSKEVKQEDIFSELSPMSSITEEDSEVKGKSMKIATMHQLGIKGEATASNESSSDRKSKEEKQQDIFGGLSPLPSASLIEEDLEDQEEGMEIATMHELGIKVERSLSGSRISELGVREWQKNRDWSFARFKLPMTFKQTTKYYFVSGWARFSAWPNSGGSKGYVEVKKGDLVEFPKRLTCWCHVIEPVYTLSAKRASS